MEEDEEEDEEEEVLGVECVGLSPSSSGGGGDSNMRWAASGGMDKSLKIWDLTSGSCRCVCPHEGSVVALRWHPTAMLVCTAALDNAVRIWDARSGLALAVLTGHRDLVTNIFFASALGGLSSGGATSSTVAVTSDIVNDRIEAFMDCIVSVSDDSTSRVFFVDSASLLNK